MSLTIERVIKAAIHFPEVAYSLKQALSSDLVVANPYYRRIGEFTGIFLDTHGSLPKTGDFDMWFDELPDRDATAVREAYATIVHQDIQGFTPAAIIEHAGKVLSQAATIRARANLMQIEDEHLTPDLLMHLAEQVAAVKPVTVEGLMDLQEFGKYGWPETAEDGWPSGSAALDRMTGGFRAGELVFLMADSGIGKSTALINFGTAAAVHGAHVLHITLELSAKASAIRYYRRMTESDRRTTHDTDEFHRRLGHWWQFAQGSIHLLYRPAFQTSPEEISQIVQLYSNLHESPDIIILDYMDLLAPSPAVARANRYEKQGHASHYLRALGNDVGAVVMTAAQARRPAGATFINNLTMASISDSYEKVRAADVLIGLVQSPAEVETHQCRLQMLKLRESPAGQDIPMFFYRDLMLLADLDCPNTRRLQVELDLAPWLLPDDE